MPSPTTKNRQELRSRFVRNAVPSEADFADLINAGLNQADDGLLKLSDGSLGLVRQSQKPEQPVLRFFADPAAEGAAWQVHLGAEEKPSLSLGAADGKPALFIDGATGNVGLGTDSLAAKLHITHANQDPNGGTLILGPTSQSNLRMGYNQDYSWIQSHGRKPLTINAVGNNVGIGTTAPASRLQITGNASITSSEGSNYACRSGFMAPGSLTVGGIDRNYGGGSSWNENTAGLLLETLDNTEIAIHDSGLRLASFMHYESTKNRFTIGRDMGWGPISEVNIQGGLRVNGRVDSLNVRIQATAIDYITTKSTNWTDMPQMIATAEIDGPTLVLFKAGGVQGHGGANVRAKFRLLIDGIQKAYTLHEFHNNGWELRDVCLFWLESLAAGSHEIKIQWLAEQQQVGACWYGDTRSLVVVRL
jgi:hypothetical protein